jgi:hypothetical protein
VLSMSTFFQYLRHPPDFQSLVLMFSKLIRPHISTSVTSRYILLKAVSTSTKFNINSSIKNEFGICVLKIKATPIHFLLSAVKYQGLS